MGGKTPITVSSVHGDVFKVFVLSNKQSKTFNQSKTENRKAANIHISEAGTSNCLAFCLINCLNKWITKALLLILCRSINWLRLIVLAMLSVYTFFILHFSKFQSLLNAYKPLISNVKLMGLRVSHKAEIVPLVSTRITFITSIYY